MSSRLNTCEELPESDDVAYAEPPKSIALYVDATKWIVGLATSSFLLTAAILGSRPDQPLVRVLAGLAIFAMAIAAAFGVRALQCYTRLANLIEVHAVKEPFEVEVRNNGYRDVRWVTKERSKRCQQLKQRLAQSNTAYQGMTWSFAAGLLLYLLYGAFYMFYTKPVSVEFSRAAASSGPVLGVIHDPVSNSDCVVLRSNTVVTCQPVPMQR